MAENQDEKKEQKTDDVVVDQAASDQDQAVASDKDQVKADSVEPKGGADKGVDDSKSSDQVPLKTEEKKKVRKPKPKADIRVQQVGHRRKVLDTDKVKERGRKIEVIGDVISDKMNKTITVQIYRKVRHPRVGKYIKRSTKFKVHDEKNVAHIGDKVLIHATRALSKTKYWKLSKVVKAGERL